MKLPNCCYVKRRSSFTKGLRCPKLERRTDSKIACYFYQINAFRTRIQDLEDLTVFYKSRIIVTRSDTTSYLAVDLRQNSKSEFFYFFYVSILCNMKSEICDSFAVGAKLFVYFDSLHTVFCHSITDLIKGFIMNAGNLLYQEVRQWSYLLAILTALFKINHHVRINVYFV